ncbi:MAG: uridine kinase, partial [Bacteroidaceae bacterium]|nr:uridine kinase [Bacteroidaceae bacterium]
MYIIGIAGGTGSGKTTVVKKIMKALEGENVAVIPQDSYYNDNTHLTMEERRKINYDHPDAFDWNLLCQQLHELRQGKAIEQPTYDYITSNRMKETIHVEPCEVIIIEGIMALYRKDLRDLMDLKIYVDTDSDVRLIRNILR